MLCCLYLGFSNRIHLRRQFYQTSTKRLTRVVLNNFARGIFAPKQLSVELQAICGGKKSLPRTEVTKNIWAYIKKNTLSQGRVIKPDAALKKIFPVASLDMLKMAAFVSKHLS